MVSADLDPGFDKTSGLRRLGLRRKSGIPVDLVAFIGDSNCAGHQANPEALVYAADPLVQVWNGDAWGQYAPNVNPGYSPEAGLAGLDYGAARGFWGPELRFIQQYRAANPGRRLYVFKYGVSGSFAMYDAAAAANLPLRGWDPASGGTALTLATTELTQAIAALASQGYSPILQLVDIHLGANDSAFAATTTGFQAALSNVIAHIRSFWGYIAGASKFVLNRVQLSGVSSSGVASVRAATEAIANAAFDVFWIDIDASSNNGAGDLIHFNAAGQISNGDLIWREHILPENALILALGADALAWWDAGSGVALAGANVTLWRDRIAGIAPAQATTTSQPLWAAADYNGGPSISSDGVDDTLLLNGVSLAALPTGANPIWVWIVAEQTATIAADGGISRTAFSYGGVASGSDRRVRRTIASSQNRVQAYIGTGAGAYANVIPNVDYSGKSLVLAKFGATQTDISVNNANNTSVSAIPATATSGYIALFATLGAHFWQGKIRDILLTQPLSPAKEAIAIAFLSAR